MSNILNNNFHNLRLNVNNDEYWDFFLNNDYFESYNFNSSSMYDDCLISLIDVALYDCVFEDDINGISNYSWELSNTSEYTLNNIGYTGFDNGLLYFRKDKITNRDFVKLYTESKYKIKNDKALQLHKVTGSTMAYEYPLTVEDYAIKLNGGFYQGFFKTECEKYQVLPSVLEQGDTWAYEFVLKKCEFDKESDKTLNDKYPENKGIFFYLGTRAENKWIYLYDENGNDECFTLSPDDYVEDAEIDVKTHKINAFLDMSLEMPSPWEETALDDYVSNKYYLNGVYNHTNFPNKQLAFNPQNINDVIDIGELILACNNETSVDICDSFGDDYLESEFDDNCDFDYIENDIDISDFVYNTDEGFVIGKYEEYFETDNKFLLFDRTCDGFNVKNWKEGSVVRYVNEKHTFNENLFLLMNRTCSGYNVSNISSLKKSVKKEYDIYADLYNNALAFRITDDGAIGYRYLVKNCDDELPYKVLEGYSNDNIIHNDKWSVIHVKINAYLDTMKLKFYVNGTLVFVTDELPKLNLRKLNEIYDKQETVPYNISLGGGTQGLCDTILPNYMIEPYRVYPLEKHFAGTFIGYFKSFKFYNCNMEFLNILNNFKYEMNNLDLN